MAPRWQALMACLCVLGHGVLPAAVPTPDTMVVARSDDVDMNSTPATSITEPTTEEASPPIKLSEMEVTSNIGLRYAHTAVVATVRNPAKRAQEATFRVLLPETAFISSFTMILDGKPYKAYVKEKEEAKQIYNQAVSQGLGAAHIASKARDSNHFTVSVNVEPNTVGIFNLTYEELLVRRNGVYNHAINLHPGALVPKLTVTVNIKEAQKITQLRVPEIRTGNEIDASPADAQNTKATIVRGQNEREATITFTPDLAEQQRLLDIYVEKTVESRVPSHRPYHYDDSKDDDSKNNEGVLGQFVVQYDVERPKNGEILVNDGYFVHFFAPSDLPPLSKHVVFVLDTSGSMMDRKIVQLREAMQTILAEFHEGDYFSIVEFASSVMVHELKEADSEPLTPYGSFSYSDYNRPQKLVPPSPATKENIAKAKVIVSRLQAAGGTNIYSALDVAVELIKKGVGWTVANASDVTPPPPTALPGAQTTAGPATVATEVAENAKTEEEVPQLEPIIIFLTDGDPTVGVTDPTRIINHLTEKNSGVNKATIFSLAFGEDADRKFLRKLSLRNDGFMRHIYEAADAALQLRDFYRQVASPLLADVHFVYPKKQVKAESLTKHRFRRYYLGSEAVVAGRVEGAAAELAPRVAALGSNGHLGREPIDFIPIAPTPVEKAPSAPAAKARDGYLPLERLWAYLTVRQLLEQRDAEDPPAAGDGSADKRALDIALKYSFVTPLTSLVVVKPNATHAVDAESVHKQTLPANYASFAARPSHQYQQYQHHAGLAGPPASAYGYDQDIGHGAALPVNYASFAARPSHQYQQYQHHAGLAGPPASAYGYGQSMLFSAAAPALSLDSFYDQEEETDTLAKPSYLKSSAYNFSTRRFFSGHQFEALTSNFVMPASTSYISTPRPAPTSTPSGERDTLAPYHLQAFAFLAPLLQPGSDVIQIPSNSTENITLKLSKDVVAPRAASGGDAACPAAAGAAGAAGGAGAGVCVYVSRCDAARTLDAPAYAAVHCSVDGYAGVCCPKEKVDVEKKD